jgi:hypothetical protein
MGTRASFWIGDPVNLDDREWLGCIAWDGHVKNFPEFIGVTTEDEFRQHVHRLSESREGFAHPDKGWPFPWDNDIFLTDRTYAFFNGHVNVCVFHYKFWPIDQYLICDDIGPEIETHKNVPAPSQYNPKQPDSIMFLSVR